MKEEENGERRKERKGEDTDEEWEHRKRREIKKEITVGRRTR